MANAPSTNAIPTEYQGVTFRSRMEARWAVFFSHLGIRWEYEPEGYQLTDGTWYLPDFWLPEVEWFMEVKPDTGMGIEKAKRLAEVTRKGVAVTHGPPNEDAWPLQAWTWDRAAESVYELDSGVILIRVSDSPHTDWFFITMRTALASRHVTYLVKIAYASHAAMTHSFWNPPSASTMEAKAATPPPATKALPDQVQKRPGGSLLARVRGEDQPAQNLFTTLSLATVAEAMPLINRNIAALKELDNHRAWWIFAQFDPISVQSNQVLFVWDDENDNDDFPGTHAFQVIVGDIITKLFGTKVEVRLITRRELASIPGGTR